MCFLKCNTIGYSSAAALVVLAGALVANTGDNAKAELATGIAQDGGLVQEGKNLLQDAKELVQEAQDELDPDEMMEAWMNANKTGDHHRMLDDIIGTFDAAMTMVHGPGMPPEEHRGVAVNTWVLDGRYVQTDFTMNFDGMEFKGLGFTAYSNADKQFQGTWMDSMSTAIEFATGSGGPDGKSMLMEATSTDPMTGMKMRIVETFKIESKDQHTFTRTAFSMDGQTQLNRMEIVYTRAE